MPFSAVQVSWSSSLGKLSAFHPAEMAAKRKVVVSLSSSESESESDGKDSVQTPGGEASGLQVAKAGINRCRSIASNSGKKAKLSDGKAALPTVIAARKSLWDRLRDFQGERLTLENGRIFCQACSEPLAGKKSTISAHVKSQKHVRGKALVEKSKVRSQTLAKALERYDKQVHPVGGHLPLDVRVWRMEVVEGFLSAGIPLSKIDQIRHLLERNNYRLTGRSHLSELIPAILENQIRLLKEELRHPQASRQYKSRPVSIIFDGSTRLGEAVAVLARFVSDNWEIKQRLLKVEVLAKSLNAAELAQVLNACLIEYTIQGADVLACMRDGASVNQAAVDILGALYPNLFDIVCFSHTIDNVGKHFDTPTLDTFSQYWTSLFSHSPQAKLRWREQTGKAMKSYSETRWWSRWEILDQLCQFYGDLGPFLDNNQDLSPKTMDHLRVIHEDPDRSRNLQLELAAVIDVGQHFVKATYYLEGDGPLVFDAYKRLQELLTACNNDYQPNIRAMATKLADGDADLADQLEIWAKQRVRPAVLWFLRKFHGEGRGGLRPMVEAFKLARFFCPVQVQFLHPTAPELNALRIFPFFSEGEIVGLQEELPAYVAAAADCRLAASAEKVDWWRAHEEELPKWSAAVKKILLLQPSSAAAERVFSLLNAAFQDHQHGALQDYLCASVMLRYNH